MRTNGLMVSVAMLLALASAVAAQQQGDPLARFQQALQREEGAGDVKGALVEYEALGADGTLPVALRARALVRAGACHERLGDDHAREAYERALALNPPADVEADAEERLARLDAAMEQTQPGAVEVLPGGDGPRVRVVAVDTDARSLLCELARAASVGIVIAPDVRGTITCTLEAVEPRKAIEVIVKTVGDYEVVEQTGGRLLRVGTRSAFAEELQLRVFPLRDRPASVATAAARRRLLEQVSALVRRSSTPGQFAGYDPVLQLLLVRAATTEWPAIELLLQGEREEREAKPAEEVTAEPRVTVEFQDANMRTVLTLIAAYSRRPLLLSPVVRGMVSVVAHDVPAVELMDAILTTAGDYRRLSTPAGDLATSRDSLEERLELEVWPLRLTPAEVWGGPWTQQIEGGRLRAHLERVCNGLTAALNVKGCLVALDPVANALVVRLPVPELVQLRRGLAAAGCVEPAAVRPGAELRSLQASTNIRAALAEEARLAGRNVIVGPQVRGEVGEGTFVAGASFEATLRLLATCVGDYEMIAGEGDTLRVTTRDDAQQLETARLPLRERTGGRGVALGAILADVVTHSDVSGALVLHQPEGSFLLATLPRPLLAQVEAAVSSLDRLVLEAPVQLVGSSVESGKHVLAVYAVGPMHPWLELRVDDPLLAELSGRNTGGSRGLGRGNSGWSGDDLPGSIMFEQRDIIVWE